MIEHGKAKKSAWPTAGPGSDPGSTFDEMLGMTEHGKAMNAKAAARARKDAPERRLPPNPA